MTCNAFDLQRAALAITGSAVEKHVLLVLATRTNEEGVCTPGIPRIALDTGLSERSVHRALVALENAGHIKRAIKTGVGTVYSVHPCQSVTPDTESPLTGSQSTPDSVSSKQPVTTNTKPKQARGSEFPRPDWADPQVWQDFMGNRKAKRLTSSPTAYKTFCDDIARLADAEWPPPRLLAYATGKGWGGIYDPRKDIRNARRPANDRNGSGLGVTFDAVDGFLQDGGHQGFGAS